MSEDFIRRQGPAFLPALLRRISEELLRGAEEWGPEAGLTSSPRIRSTLLALDEHGPMGVVEVAKLLHQSHPLVITWIKQLRADGFAKTRTDTADRRRTVVALTAKGVAEVRQLRKVLPRMSETAQALMDEAAPGLFEALWRMEQACRREPFADRLREATSRAARGKRRTGKR
ncbi:MAG TPA: MarR family winged helix-turn-helix transcriptional regulator [Gammaproteobacteria bacterium]